MLDFQSSLSDSLSLSIFHSVLLLFSLFSLFSPRLIVTFLATCTWDTKRPNNKHTNSIGVKFSFHSKIHVNVLFSVIALVLTYFLFIPSLLLFGSRPTLADALPSARHERQVYSRRACVRNARGCAPFSLHLFWR